MNQRRRRLNLAIRGGTVVTADATFEAEIGVRDGRIVEVAERARPAERDIDARGFLVMPGGIDMHVHLTVPAIKPHHQNRPDDFTSGTEAAAVGGITTVGSMHTTPAGIPLNDALAVMAREIESKSVLDFVLHPVILDPESALPELPALAASGRTSLKIYTILGEFDRRSVEFLRLLGQAGANGILPMIHCEDPAILAYASESLMSQGLGTPTHFPDSRPEAAEIAAVARVLAMAEVADAPVYIVHVSTGRAIELISAARSRGVRAFAEARPLYLYLSRDKFARPDAALYVSYPPLRGRSDIEAVWNALEAGDIQTYCSDHASWLRDQKLEPDLDVRTLLPGTADLETLLPLLFSEGVLKHRLPLQRFVELTSTNAARIFGLGGQKGNIAIGYDADLMVWDPTRRRTVRAAEGRSKADFSLYEDWEVTGWPAYTIARGDVIVENGQVTGAAGRGREIRRRQSPGPCAFPLSP